MNKKENIETRRACLNAAGRIVAEIIKGDDQAGTVEAKKWTRELAEDFEAWVNR